MEGKDSLHKKNETGAVLRLPGRREKPPVIRLDHFDRSRLKYWTLKAKANPPVNTAYSHPI